jgi:hypothetical protein
MSVTREISYVKVFVEELTFVCNTYIATLILLSTFLQTLEPSAQKITQQRAADPSHHFAVLQELNTLFLTRFRTYKIARPFQTKI